MHLIALRITATTYRGTLKGIPTLVELLRRHGAGASFAVSLGPDNGARALRRLFRAGHLGQASRTGAFRHYGMRSLLNGALLPAPQIGRRAVDILGSLGDSDFEVGLHGYDAMAWEDLAATASAAWSERQMRQASERYADIFKKAPAMHAAVNWQMNPHALRLTQRMGFRYASDTRGTHPFMPVYNGEVMLCPQIPTTLPTTDELVGLDGVDEDGVVQALLRHTAIKPAQPHVFTLRAEREGMKLAPHFELLLTGWLDQGYSMVAMQDIVDRLDRDTLPHHQVIRGTVPGRIGSLMMQGKEYLADWQDTAG
jgi:undecaprenyl phosphate-alpha-L-ara4FN deformylase